MTVRSACCCCCVRLLAVALLLRQALGIFLQEIVEGLAQLLRQLLDLLGAGALLQRLAQLLLRRLELALGIGQVAFLDPEGDLPQIVDDAAQLVVAARLAQARPGGSQAEIGPGVLGEHVGRDHQGVERVDHGGLGIGVEAKLAALLDEGAGERLDEGPARQARLLRLAQALVAGIVARHQGHRDRRAGEGVLGHVAGGGGD